MARANQFLVLFADGEGDPPRTLNCSSAKEFGNFKDAKKALGEARKHRAFADGKVEPK